MSDLFASLSARGAGIERPNVVMNDGPYPGRFPAGMGDNAGRIDGEINAATTLLGDDSVQPYAYGHSKHLSTQQAFLNVPHRVMKIVPIVPIPAAISIGGGLDFVNVSHAVDDGDIAFVLRMDPSAETSRSLSLLSKLGFDRNVINSFLNVAGVNYLLAGLQRLAKDADGIGLSWEYMWTALNVDRSGCRLRNAHATPDDLLKLVRYLVSRCLLPFGVVHGSERQGGLNDTSSSPATWPVSFVTTLVVDGNVKNLVNLWAAQDICAGADLALALQPLHSECYTVNHYFKDAVTEKFGDCMTLWQLVPVVDPWSCSNYGGWHVARSQIRRARRPGADSADVNNDATRMSGGLLEATFCPTFHDTSFI